MNHRHASLGNPDASLFQLDAGGSGAAVQRADGDHSGCFGTVGRSRATMQPALTAHNPRRNSDDRDRSANKSPPAGGSGHRDKVERWGAPSVTPADGPWTRILHGEILATVKATAWLGWRYRSEIGKIRPPVPFLSLRPFPFILFCAGCHQL